MTAYLAALALGVSSMVVGAGVLRLCGFDAWTPATPGVGLAALVVVASAAFHLPGAGLAAGIALLVLTLGAVIVSRLVVAPLSAVPAFAAATLALLGASVPFVANGRIGILGVSRLDDLAQHMLWADALRTSFADELIYPNYPLGPHMLVSAFAHVSGTSVEPVFTGLLLATPMLTAVAAFTLLGGSAVLRVPAAALVALPYLAASFLGEGSFKEPIMALLLVAAAWLLGADASRRNGAISVGVAFGIVAAAGLLMYGLPGVAWPLSLWFVVTTLRVATGRDRRPRALVAWNGYFAAAALLTALAGVGLATLRVLRFKTPTAGTNVPDYLPPHEALGVWFATDFRISSPDAGTVTTFAVLGLVLAAGAVTLAVRRGDVVLPSAAIAAGIVYAFIRWQGNPYLSAKPLAILSVALMLLVMALLTPTCATGAAKYLSGAFALGAIVYACVAAWSTGIALRNSPVGPLTWEDDLAPIRAITRGARTLYLIADDFSLWKLRGAQTVPITLYGPPVLEPVHRREGRFRKSLLDVDAVTSSSLDTFRYIVTTRSRFASIMPSNWTLLRTTSFYEVWERHGATPQRAILDEGNAPGHVLSCRHGTPPPGIATIWKTPPVGPSRRWASAGLPVLIDRRGAAVVAAGHAVSQRVRLPTGKWELSLAYQSVFPIRVTVGKRYWSLPPNLDLYGSYWRVGSVVTRSQNITVQVGVSRPPHGLMNKTQGSAGIGPLAFVSGMPRHREVPMSRACGAYVDSYRRSISGTGANG
jgi:hypothetical protein